MTRIAIIADSHFDEHSRFDDCVRIHDWIATDLAQRGVDLVLHAGDIFERRSSPKERLAFAAWLQRIADVAPVVIVRGNHDAIGDLALFADLETAHPVIVEEGAAVHFVSGVAVGCLAWPRRAELLASVGLAGREMTELAAGDALRAVIRGLGAEMSDHAGPRVLLAHAMVRGSITSSGQPLVGCDLEVGIEDLSLANADFVALGHIHAGQAWETTSGAPIAYPGSPRRATFGELEEKAYLVADVSSLGVTVTRVATPATPMVHVNAAVSTLFGEATFVVEDEQPIAGAEVRLRYEVDADQREAGKRLAFERKTLMLFDGAVDVVVEEVVRATTRARAPKVAKAASLAEKLRAYWEAKGDLPDDERAAALLDKLHEIDGEVPRSTATGCPGRFEAIRGRNVGPFKAFDVDLSAIPGPLVAVTGDNGAGKSTLLELIGGAHFRRTPTRGTLVELATARDAMVEARVWNGGTFTLRHLIDAVSRKSEAVAIDATGRPLTDAGKVREFDAWAEKNLPSPDVLYTSTFAPQGSGGFLDLDPGPRKAILLRTLGIERLEALAERARKRVDEAKSGLRTLEARIADERGRSTSIDDALIDVAAHEATVAEARTALVAAEKAAKAAERAHEAQVRALEERVAIERQIDALDRDILGAVRRRRDAKALADRAPALTVARERVAALSVQRDAARDALTTARAALAAEREELEADRKRAVERAALVEKRKATFVFLERAQGDLRSFEAIAAKAGEIESAKALVVDLEAFERSRRTRLVEADARVTAARRVDADAKSHLVGIRHELSLSRSRLDDAAKVLAGEADVVFAAESLPEHERKIFDAQREVESLEAIIAGARESMLNSKDRRIDGMRGALVDVVDAREISAAWKRANNAIQDDREAAEQAEGAPATIAAAEASLATLKTDLLRVERTLRAMQQVAARLPAIEDARALRDGSSETVARLEAEIAEREADAVTRASVLELLVQKADAALAELRQIEGDLADARNAVADADAVTRAAAQVEPLARDVARLEGELADLGERIEAMPQRAPGDRWDVAGAVARAESDLASLADEIADYERTLADADAIARAAAEVDAADRDIERGELEVARLRAKLTGIESTPPLDVDGALTAAQTAHAADRAANQALAKAMSALDLARESDARLGDLQALLDSALLELGDWTRLSLDLGRDGIQALEVDAAGPELASIANDLLHSCVSRRWTIDIRTQRTSADGKKQIEGCDVMVLDTQEGREGEGKTFSGGERVLIGEAVSLALAVFACRRLGVEGPTLVRDESGAALAPENGRRYIEMLRRAAATIGADKVLYVSHTSELQELADGRIHVGGGTARVVPVAYQPTSASAPEPVETYVLAAE